MLQLPAKLTFHDARSVLENGLRAIDGGEQRIDFSKVDTVDSSAVGLLLAWRRAASAKGAALHFDHLPATLLSLAGLYGVTSLIAADVVG